MQKGGKTLLLVSSQIAQLKSQRYAHNDRYDPDTGRTQAFEVLENKDRIKELLTKTKMCRSVGTGKCPHGDKCRFAHSLGELKVPTCFFNERCRFVKQDYITGVWSNTGGKVCNGKHPDETEEQVFKRTGMDKMAIGAPKPAPIRPVRPQQVRNQGVPIGNQEHYRRMCMNTMIDSQQRQLGLAHKIVDMSDAYRRHHNTEIPESELEPIIQQFRQQEAQRRHGEMQQPRAWGQMATRTYKPMLTPVQELKTYGG